MSLVHRPSPPVTQDTTEIELPDAESTDVYAVLPEEITYSSHTKGRPFCEEMGHECHENPELIADLESYRQDGLVSDGDVQRIYRGQTVG